MLVSVWCCIYYLEIQDNDLNLTGIWCIACPYSRTMHYGPAYDADEYNIGAKEDWITDNAYHKGSIHDVNAVALNAVCILYHIIP